MGALVGDLHVGAYSKTIEPFHGAVLPTDRWLNGDG